MNSVNKILVLRYSSIGDIIACTPVFRWLSLNFPKAEITWATKEEFAFVLGANPYIDKIITLKKKQLSAHIKCLKEEDFDLVVDLHKSLNSRRVCAALKKESLSFEKRNIAKFIYTLTKSPILPIGHIVDRYAEMFHKAKLKTDSQGLEFEVDERTLSQEVKQFVSEHPNYIALSLASSKFTKQIPLEKLKELHTIWQNKPVVLLGGKGELSLANALANAFPDDFNNRLFSFVGASSFNDTAFLIRQSSYLITPDTATLHLGSAFKKPMAIIWGNTTPLIGMGAYKTEELNNEVQGLSCRPCSKIGYAKCPKGHFKCMMNQDFSELIAKVTAL